jgi:SAM-dependent MidA family methyltransferase
VLAERIRTDGPVSFAEYMELALYEPHVGFFSRGAGAGRGGGDFLTSAEVGPLFGAMVATWLDGVWDRLGRPDPFVVHEAGAGRGALALAVRAAGARCAPCLHYVMVERSDALRAAQSRHLDPVALTAPLLALQGGGPQFSSAAELPSGPLRGAVVANELLDNLPCRLVELGDDGWSEVKVALGPNGELREVRGPLTGAMARRCEALAPDAAPGARVPLQEEAHAWVSSVLERLEGELLVFDYGAATSEMAERPVQDWLRTYRNHRRGGPVLSDPGSQDVTVEVALDQLPTPWSVRRQREWLVDHGLEAMVAEARREWSERAAIGDLRALRARSVPREAEALCDPGGLGAFWALEWRSHAAEPGGPGGYDPRGTTQESTEP